VVRKFTAEEVKAIKDSRAHWRRLAKGTQRPKENIFADSCALCDIFFGHCTCQVRDVLCPIRAKYGVCGRDDKNPWAAARNASDSGSNLRTVGFKREAARMADAIDALLPKAPRKKAQKKAKKK
jgi:hypothetical protein